MIFFVLLEVEIFVKMFLLYGREQTINYYKKYVKDKLRRVHKKDKFRKKKANWKNIKKVVWKKMGRKSIEQLGNHFPQRKEQDENSVCYKHVYGTCIQPKLTDIDKSGEKKTCHWLWTFTENFVSIY